MSEDTQKKEDLQKGKRMRYSNTSESAADENDESLESVPLYKNFKLVIPLFILVLVIAILVWNWYIGMRDYISTDDAYIDGNRVSISSKIMGRIDTLLADEGDTVHQNQILVHIDDADIRAQETQTNAALTLAQASVLLAKVTLSKSESDFKRASTQYKENIIPKEQLDHAQSEYESSQARFKIAIAQLSSARAQLGVVETQLKNTVINAPMDGIISKRWALAGDVVQAGQPIFSIYDLKNIWITANLEETNIEALQLNDSVKITVDSYVDRKFYGRVFQVGSNTASQFSLIPPNNASGNFTKVTQRIPVKISIYQVLSSGERPVTLLPGMSVEIKVRIR